MPLPVSVFFLNASIRLHFTELVYAMQSNSSTDDAMNLLRRIAHTPGAYNFSTQSLASALQWAEWGGRGWLGMYFKTVDMGKAYCEAGIYDETGDGRIQNMRQGLPKWVIANLTL